MLLKHLKKFFSGLYTLFLISLLLLFVLRPAGKGGVYIALWQFCFIAVIVAAIFNSIKEHWLKIIASIIAFPAIIFNWLSLSFPENNWLLGLYLASAFSFIFVCAISIINQVVLHARVTVETLRGVICAYFLVAFAFAYFYYFIEFILPGSFSSLFPETSFLKHTHFISEMMYFSFVTLLTIGFGDIAPLNSVSRTFVILEGIIGQFYIAILVARLVAVYSFYSNKELFKKGQLKSKKE
jgi:hypothetical protein